MTQKAPRSQDRFVTSIMKVAALGSFVADSIAIFLFIREITVTDGVGLPTERSISLGIVIILAFLFSISFVKFSGDRLSESFAIFGLVYAVLAQMMLILTSFVVTPNLAPIGELGLLLNEGDNVTMYLLENGWGVAFYYMVASIIVTIFARIVVGKSQRGIRLAVLPYVLGSILIIGHLIVTIMEKTGMPLLSLTVLVLELGIISVFWSPAFRTSTG